MTNMEPISPDPVLLGGNWVGQPETQWFDQAREQLRQAVDEDDSAGRVFTAANGVSHGLIGETGEAATSQFMRASTDKRNVAAGARRIANTYKQAGRNVLAAKTAQNNVLASYQSAEATNSALAVSQQWAPYKTAAESMKLRGDARNAIEQIRRQFDQVQDALFGDFGAGRDPSPGARMPGSESTEGGAPALSPSPNPGGGSVLPAGGLGGAAGGISDALGSLTGNPQQTAGLLQSVMPMVSTFMPVILGMMTSGMSALTGGTGSMAGMGPASLGSPYGTPGMAMGGGFGGSPMTGGGLANPGGIGAGVPGAAGLGGGLTGAGLPPAAPGGGTPAIGNVSGPGSGGSGNKAASPLADIGKKIDDVVHGKTRLGLVHDEDDQTTRVVSVGSDGTREDLFREVGDNKGGADPGQPIAGDGGEKSGESPQPGADPAQTPEKQPDAAPARPDSGDSSSEQPASPAGATDSPPPAGTPETTPAGADNPVPAGTPQDHQAPSGDTTAVPSEQMAAHLTVDDLAPRIPAVTGAIGTDLTAGAPAAAAPSAPTGATPVAPAAHLSGGMPPMAAPAGMGGAPMPPAMPGAAMPHGSGMPMMPMMPPLGGPGAHPSAMAPASPAGAPAAAGTGTPPQTTPVAITPDPVATHAPITPRTDGAGPVSFPTTGPAAYLSLLSLPKARAHTHLAAIAASQEEAGVQQPAAIGVFERAGIFTYVYASVDGLGYIPSGVELPSEVTPLSVLASGDGEFFKRWAGFIDPIAKLRAFAASPKCSIGGFVGGAAMDTAEDTALQTREQKDGILGAGVQSPVSTARVAFSSLAPLNRIGLALQSELAAIAEDYRDGLDMNRARVIAARWDEGDHDARYPYIWRAYLCYAAERAVMEGDVDAARYYATEMSRMSSAL